MPKFNLKKVDAKKIMVSFLLVISLVVQFSFLSYLFKAIMPDQQKDDENVIMTYTQKGNLDYHVYLKPNEFIGNESADEKEAYILNFIDYVNITSLYDFDSTTKTNVNGTNKLVATLKIYYKESSDKSQNPEVMAKEYMLDEKDIKFNDDKYSTTSSYDVYLDDYVKTVQEFQNTVKISTDAYLEISMKNDISGSVGGASYDGKYNASISIPLSDSVVRINSPKAEEKTEKIYESDLVKTNKTVMGYIVIANIVTFIIICLLLRKLFLFTNKSEYDRTLSKILNNYDDIIVNTSTILDIDKYKLIEIDEFKEILNLSRELLLPIMNYEIVKGKTTWFYVIKDDVLYRYVVSQEALEKRKNEKQRSKKENEEKEESDQDNN